MRFNSANQADPEGENRMLRIQIQEKWWSDPRHNLMMVKYGCLALGKAVTLWQVAAWHAHYENTHLIDKPRISFLEDWEYLLAIGLMREVTDDIVYVCGSSKYLPLKQRQAEPSRRKQTLSRNRISVKRGTHGQN